MSKVIVEVWTPEERKNCKKLYGCEVLIENSTYEEVCIKETPNDAYIVEYMLDGKTCFDLTRGTTIRIFDMYWDKFREDLKNIIFGYGKVSSKVWGYKPPEKKKRK